uniref:Laccase-20 n=1 Tax=Magallana gigas TaxID=29159 RepID=K1Q401_MAGGI
MPELGFLPLETFRVKLYQYYRFRTINACFLAALEISVDDHMLIIVAVDGNDVVPFKTDIVVIKPGESVDYIIFTDRPHDNYRINYITTATSDVTGETFTSRRSTYAILNYHGVDENEIPIIRQRACSPIVPCKAVNQVFG